MKILFFLAFSFFAQAQVPAPFTDIQVSHEAGFTLACGALKNGEARCWGTNARGEADLPVNMTDVKMVVPFSAYDKSYACAIHSQGKVTCWGAMTGNGENLMVPADLPPAADLILDRDKACILTPEREIVCWGSNSKLDHLKNIKKIANRNGTWGPICAISDEGKLTCDWMASGNPPQDLGPVVDVATAMHSICALEENGRVSCWGAYSPPSPSQKFPRAKQIVLSGKGACVVKEAGNVACWGNDVPVVPVDWPAVERILPGFDFICGQTADNKLYCTEHAPLERDEDNGEYLIPPFEKVLVDGSTICLLAVGGGVNCYGSEVYITPSDTSPLRQFQLMDDGYVTLDSVGTLRAWSMSRESKFVVNDVQSISTGLNFYCGIYGSSGSVFCFGRSDFGQAKAPSWSLRGFDSVWSGSEAYHTCGLTEGRIKTCWGLNTFGQTNYPLGLEGVKQISASLFHTCALATNGVTCWGYLDTGIASIPANSRDFVQITSGQNHICGLDAAGKVTCWGSNIMGQLEVPEDLPAIKKIQAEHMRTCALSQEGQLYCWGLGTHDSNIVSNSYGPFTDFAISTKKSCALKENGALICSGHNRDYLFWF